MLKCTSCGREYSLRKPYQRCECGEPLELELFKSVPGIGKRVWERFSQFYPFELDLEYSLGEGDTPLTKAKRLSKELGVELYLKNETLNPTWSFKDRGTFIGIHRALELGFNKIGTVSTGNMAASVAAYGARFGLETYILVSSTIVEEKLKALEVYGAKVIKVRGDYGGLYYRSLEIGQRKGIYFINSDDPFRVEGYKSIGFEIAEEVTPDYVVIPTSSGGLFRGIVKGFLELKESGLIEDLPTFVAVQAEGCSPICKAFNESRQKIERFENPHTIAHAIENPYPPSGNAVLRLLNELKGLCVAVSDEEILEAQQDLGREGIFVQPASATGIAAIKKLRGRIEEDTKVVSILTGSGLKTHSQMKAVKVMECSLESLEECMG
ncbi:MULTISPECIES: threonine synthase [Thermococcus]|uniref:Threonine synthase n=2 Tax=Thermococcus sibiricus TaxID=172049 RepID=C6A3C7_THESM|nr:MULTISPECIES: threonine synthase [Thermococcus]KUK29078.1 MAG: Threonine synthase [Thermococcus sp. 40_45]HII68169.1 threonine synthase [Thermococcaceae archaeon]ACS90122.1 Threonine synthase [Thermococcus sibiricus MM 739]KUK18675.1 MAG: Threonine synthase [Thermococcus sibiricus]MBC7094960.1 threonine synthase [Thermococcus sp.]